MSRARCVLVLCLWTLGCSDVQSVQLGDVSQGGARSLPMDAGLTVAAQAPAAGGASGEPAATRTDGAAGARVAAQAGAPASSQHEQDAGSDDDDDDDDEPDEDD